MMGEIYFEKAANEYLIAARADYDRPSSWLRIAVSLRAVNGYFGGMPVGEISAAGIEDFKRTRLATCKPVTVRHDLYALSLFLKHARREAWIAGKPMEDVLMPSDRDAVRIRVVTAEEERRYLQAAAKGERQLYTLAKAMLGTGLRPGEFRMLRCGDVSEDRIAIRQGKSRAARRTLRVVDGELGELLMKAAGRRGSSEFLFPGPEGQPPATLNNAHGRVCRRTGMVDADGRRALRIYDLRHTFATRMASKGMPLTTLAAILGHSNLRCVMIYVHPQQAAMDDALLQFAHRGEK